MNLESAHQLYWWEKSVENNTFHEWLRVRQLPTASRSSFVRVDRYEGLRLTVANNFNAIRDGLWNWLLLWDLWLNLWCRCFFKAVVRCLMVSESCNLSFLSLRIFKANPRVMRSGPYNVMGPYVIWSVPSPISVFFHFMRIYKMSWFSHKILTRFVPLANKLLLMRSTMRSTGGGSGPSPLSVGIISSYHSERVFLYNETDLRRVVDYYQVIANLSAVCIA